MKLQLDRLLHTTSCCWYLASKLLVLGTEEKINLQQVDMTFYVLTFDFFMGALYIHNLNHSLLGVPRKMVLLKFDKHKER